LPRFLWLLRCSPVVTVGCWFWIAGYPWIAPVVCVTLRTVVYCYPVVQTLCRLIYTVTFWTFTAPHATVYTVCPVPRTTFGHTRLRLHTRHTFAGTTPVTDCRGYPTRFTGSPRLPGCILQTRWFGSPRYSLPHTCLPDWTGFLLRSGYVPVYPCRTVRYPVSYILFYIDFALVTATVVAGYTLHLHVWLFLPLTAYPLRSHIRLRLRLIPHTVV